MIFPFYAILSYGSKIHGTYQTAEEAHAALPVKKQEAMGAYLMVKEILTVEDLMGLLMDLSRYCINEMIHDQYSKAAHLQYERDYMKLQSAVLDAKKECKERGFKVQALERLNMDPISY
jgi:hypothetical protein